MLEGRLLKQCRFTFGQRKKDYHLLSSNVQRRPPSHSSSGMWKHWGKLNLLQLTLFPVCEFPDGDIQSKHCFLSIGCRDLMDCSETETTAN